MATEKSITYKSKDGITDISAKYWMPEGEPKAVFQIIHGMVEHKDRYTDFANYLAEHGILVCANDHLGHGESVTSQEKWGYMTKDNPSEVLNEDVHELRKLTQETYPGLPYFMLGHSMGSFIIRKYIAKYGEGLSGAIIMGTGQNSGGASGFALFLVSLIAAFKGWDHRSQFIQNLTYSKAYKKFDLTGEDKTNSWLTRDEKIVRSYADDPACGYLFTLSGHKGLFELTKYIDSAESFTNVPKELPLLITSGADDPVGDLSEGVKKACRRYEDAGIKDITLKLYPGARHEILNEINRAEVYEDILNWLEARIRA